MRRRELMAAITGSAVSAAAGVTFGGTREAWSLEANCDFKRFHVCTADGVRINVVETGRASGTAIIFIHGNSQSWKSWINQLSDPWLRSHFRLIALDLRGHGNSEGAFGALDDDGIPLPLLPDEKYNTGDPNSTAQLWANDVNAVFNALCPKDATLVGWSYGGIVVGDYLYTHRGLGAARKALIIASTPVLLPVGSGDGSIDRVFTPEASAALGPTLPGNSNIDIASGLTEFVELCLTDTVPGRPPASTADVLAGTAFNVKAPPEFRAAVAGRSLDYRPFFAGLPSSKRSQIRVITPLSDRAAQAQNCIKYWQQAKLTNDLVPNEGHLYFYRNPDGFNAKLAAFAT